MDVGSNLGDTIKHQTIHEELISKLKVIRMIILFLCVVEILPIDTM